ncbi:tetratricopeptide repeat protein [Gymnodinialimonas hymeniacidonis]|uniref:tetratricopeptide repeat protein n=1 Tax=Gymnodinialimonas hymeniacidonis TaxID=3126508 RepID=UPI0034C6D5D4
MAESETVSGFLAQLQSALSDADLKRARNLVAEEEGRLEDMDRVEAAGARARVAAAKARIAVKSGDGAAAHAILVAAIETNPTDRALRVLMSEVMLATGRATDVRPVLKHIGRVGVQASDGDLNEPLSEESAKDSI